jgi:hypothetical protein
LTWRKVFVALRLATRLDGFACAFVRARPNQRHAAADIGLVFRFADPVALDMA